MKAKLFACFLMLLFAILGRSAMADVRKFTLQTTAPLVSLQHNRLNGAGLGIQTERIVVNFFWVQYCDRSQGSLLYLSGEGWVRVRWGKLIQVSYRIPANLFDFCIGTNYLILSDENHFGYQLAVQRWMNEFAFIRLGIGQVGLAKSIFINIGIDLPVIIKEARRQLDQ